MRDIGDIFLKGFLLSVSFLGMRGLYILAYILHPLFYFAIPKYRKRALSNLKLASDLNLSDQEIKKIARLSLFNLLLTALEYGILYRVKTIKSFCKNLNPFQTDTLLDQKQGVIFFCGHQANWELLFLDATSRHKGVCIGKPQKNKKLYEFVLKIRQKFQGKVITPKDAYKGCIRALKAGELVGVVGDQGMPDSPFSYNCLGRTAHMTTLPALLSIRSKAPLFVATIVRHFGKYEITYTGPVKQESEDVSEISEAALKILDTTIKKHPEQYMWQHNRWKISYKDVIPKKFRHDAIACVIENPSQLEDLKTLQELYKGAYFILFYPKKMTIDGTFQEKIPYETTQDLFITHYGPKLMFDFVSVDGLEKHFKKQSLFAYIQTTSVKDTLESWGK